MSVALISPSRSPLDHITLAINSGFWRVWTRIWRIYMGIYEIWREVFLVPSLEQMIWMNDSQNWLKLIDELGHECWEKAWGAIGVVISAEVEIGEYRALRFSCIFTKALHPWSIHFHATCCNNQSYRTRELGGCGWTWRWMNSSVFQDCWNRRSLNWPRKEDRLVVFEWTISE